MKVKANQWVNYNGTWCMAGSEFNVNEGDMEEIRPFVTVLSGPDEQEAQQEEPAPKRGRKRKTDE